MPVQRFKPIRELGILPIALNHAAKGRISRFPQALPMLGAGVSKARQDENGLPSYPLMPACGLTSDLRFSDIMPDRIHPNVYWLKRGFWHSFRGVYQRQIQITTVGYYCNGGAWWDAR